MTVFNIFEHPQKGPDSAVAVPEGFSPRAFVFTVLWALWHRMWIVAAVLVILLAGLALAVMHWGLPPAAVAILNFGIALIFGIEANTLRGLSLRWAGYEETAVIEAQSVEVAELEHVLAQRIRTVPRSVMHQPPPIQPPADTLGLFGNV